MQTPAYHLRAMKRALPLLAVALLVFASLTLSACGGSDQKAPTFNGETRFKLPGGTVASLPAYGEELRGETRPLRASPGKLMLIFFGFTSCPDVCPTTMSALGAAVRSLPQDQQEKIEAAMVTVDPARDSGPGIVRYLAHFFPGRSVFGFRSSTKSELSAAEKAFGAHSEIPRHKPGSNYDVEHSAYRYAVDHRGRIKIVWPSALTSDQIASDLKILVTDLKASPESAITVSDVWVRETAPGQRAGAVYLKIVATADDRLIGVEVPKSVAADAQLHVTQIVGDSDGATMQHASQIETPAKATTELSPNGAHLMLLDLKRPIRRGQRIPLTLNFAKAGRVPITATARL